jgi:hypothetical protein
MSILITTLQRSHCRTFLSRGFVWLGRNECMVASPRSGAKHDWNTACLENMERVFRVSVCFVHNYDVSPHVDGTRAHAATCFMFSVTIIVSRERLQQQVFLRATRALTLLFTSPTRALSGRINPIIPPKRLWRAIMPKLESASGVAVQ